MSEFNILSKEQEQALTSILEQLGDNYSIIDSTIISVNDELITYLCRSGYFKSEQHHFKNEDGTSDYDFYLIPTLGAKMYFQQRKAYRETFRYENIKVPLITSIVSTLSINAILWFIIWLVHTIQK